MIGISCPGFSMTPFPEIVERIAPHFELFEIIAEGMHELPLIRNDVKTAMETYDLRFAVHAPFSDLNLATLNPRIRETTIEQITEAVRISSDLGIKVITIHPGHKSPLGAYFEDRFVKANKESIKGLDSLQEEYGVVLALENMPKMWISLCHDAKQMRELTDGTDIKLCFDLGHANISRTIDEILELREDFANVHVHDNNGDRDHHLVLGKGNMDIPGILRELRDYLGDYVIESTDLKEGIQSKGILENILNEL